MSPYVVWRMTLPLVVEKGGDVIRMSLMPEGFLDVTLHDYGANVAVEFPFVLCVLCVWLQEVDVTHGSCFVCA